MSLGGQRQRGVDGPGRGAEIQANVAERLDVSAATVGEHLRKIESRVFSVFVAEE
jgi:predicted DNA binding protein